MDSLTRVRHAIDRKPLDRIPRYDSFWEDTLTLWREQGLPATSPEEFFDWDLRMMYIDASMCCPQKILQSDESCITFQDRAGYTAQVRGQVPGLGVDRPRHQGPPDVA